MRKKDKQDDASKKGKQRMAKYEDKNQVEEIPIIKPIDTDDEYEEYYVTAYQKIDPGEWHRVELKYKRKKRL